MAEIMVRYDDLRRYCEKRHRGSVPIEYIKQMPTIEAEPVRHGRWMPTVYDRIYQCSVCHFEQTSNPNQRFCSYCGAKMNGDVDNA